MCTGHDQYYIFLYTSPGQEQVSEREGSLTSSAEEVFFTNVQVEVFNTQPAVLDMNFLLFSISVIFYFPFALVGVFSMRCAFWHNLRSER